MSKKKKRFDKVKEVKALSREQVGIVKPTRQFQDKKKKPKYRDDTDIQFDTD